MGVVRVTGSDDTGTMVPDDADRIPDTRPRPTPLWALLSRWLTRLEAWLRSHGGTPLRYGIRAVWIAIAAIAAFLLVGPVINPPLSLDDITESASTATETWIARDFDANYTITRDADGRLNADVVETITAFFPDDVDESGIERILATQYEGHDLAPRGLEVEIDGAAVEPDVRSTADRLHIELDTGERLRGDHEFVIRYSLSDLAYTATDDVTGGPVDLLEWSVFGPSWPQAFSALNVSVTLPDELDELLVRQPFGGVAWTLVSGADWLDREEDSPAGQNVYAFSVDQNMPPYSLSWFRMVFPEGTFTMPPPTPLFILQTFGPLIPLGILLLTLPFSLAARAVAWSDARGRPWYVAQYSPPKNVSAAQAAQIMRRPRTRELAVALATLAGSSRSQRPEALAAVGRAAQRTGRVGDRVRARSAYLFDRARHAQIADGFRRIPRGFVRDAFIAAPLALTLVQLAIIRQLSHQETLAVIWWPGLFAFVSFVISAIVLGIALSSRPLTRKGALARQHLLGVDVYAEQTSMLERVTIDDALLPYAVVTADPRDAGRSVVALVDRELGAGASRRGWRTGDFLSWPRLILRTAAILIVAGAIVMVALVPNPYERVSTYDRYDFESRGTLYVQVDNAEVEAHISAEDDQPRIDATMRFDIEFDDDSRRVPQFAVPVLNAVDGQDLGLVVDAVTIDGESVPFEVTENLDVSTITTVMGDVRVGEAEAVVTYAHTSPAVIGEGSPVSGEQGAPVDRIRWAALLDGWESGWTHPSAPDPVAISVRIDDDVIDRTLSAGWLREDPDTAEEARDWKDSSYAFGTLEDVLGAPEHLTEAEYGTLVEGSTRADAGVVHSLTVTEGEYGYPTRSTYSDLGVLLEFPAGTWAGPDADARDAEAFAWALPIIVVTSTGGLAILLGGIAVARSLLRGRRMTQGTLRDLFWWIGPAAALAASIVCVWATGNMPASWAEGAIMLWAAGLAVVAAITSWVVVRPPERATPPPVSKRHHGRKRSRR